MDLRPPAGSVVVEVGPPLVSAAAGAVCHLRSHGCRQALKSVDPVLSKHVALDRGEKRDPAVSWLRCPDGRVVSGQPRCTRIASIRCRAC